MKVLVVEDDAASLLVMRAKVSALGHEVETAEDGAAAWVAFDQKPFPVVVCDWMLPEMDGLELCRRIRARPRTEYTYFILVSAGHTKREDHLRAIEAGADDFLTKPVNSESLMLRLRVAERIIGLQGRVEKLEGILPVCAVCRRIRDATGNYGPLDYYIQQHTGATISHTYCPDCVEKMLK